MINPGYESVRKFVMAFVFTLQAATEYESVRKFISRAWPPILYDNIVSQSGYILNKFFAITWVLLCSITSP